MPQTTPTASPEMEVRALEMEVRDLPRRHTATVRETVVGAAIPATLGRIFGLVMTALARQGVSPSGPPFAWYHTFGAELDIEAGFPVLAPIEPDGDVRPGELPGGPALSTVHVGSYDALEETYRLMEDRMRELGRTADGGPFECYLDPPTTPTADTRTEIHQPLRRS